MNAHQLQQTISRYGLCLLLMMAIVTAVRGQTTPGFSINESPLPPPTGFVNDFAGVLDQAAKDQLEAKLRELKQNTEQHAEIAVAIVRTTGERDIFDYSLAVARGWKIGSKLDDNPSALLFVAVDDRKYFTQVSRDLEDELPDGLAGSLQRQYLVPEFKKGNYAKGISDTVDAYAKTIKTGPPPATNTTRPGAGTRDRASGSLSGLFCCGIVILVLALILFSRSRGGRSGNDRDRWGGGGFGGGGGMGSALPWIIGSAISSAASSSSSSDSGWGGSSGGGSDWGGFGGGGDFGGGGAGGDW